MISSLSILTPITPHRGQGQVWCRGQGSAYIEHDGLVSHVIDFPLDDAIVDLIDDIEDTNVVFYVPNATDIPIVSDVSIALDVLVAYDVLIASDVLVAINVSIASDVPVASEVQLAYDVPFDVHITFDVHASINVTYQRCPRRKRRALPCGTWSLQLMIVLQMLPMVLIR